jgi:hypothetical protein
MQRIMVAVVVSVSLLCIVAVVSVQSLLLQPSNHQHDGHHRLSQRSSLSFLDTHDHQRQKLPRTVLSVSLYDDPLEKDGTIDSVAPSGTGTTRPRGNSNSNNNSSSSNALQSGLIQIGVGAMLALVVYMVLTTAINSAVGLVTSAGHALGDEVLRELGHLGSNLWTLLVSVIVAVWEILKVAVPFVGKGIVTAGKVAAPMVEEAGRGLTEAASPYVQEAARAVNEAATPYMETVKTAVDTSIVTPVKSVVDANLAQVDATINGATQSLTTTLQGVTDQATTTLQQAVDANIIAPIDATINGATQSLSTTLQGVTDQATTTSQQAVDVNKIIAPIQDVSSKLDGDAMTKPIRDALPMF